MSENRGLLERISWRLVLDVFSRGTFFVIAVIVGRTLSVQDFGKYGYALSFVFFVATFIDLGIHLQLMKSLGAQKGKNENMWRDYWNLKFGMVIVCALLLLPFMPFIWKWEKPWVLYFVLFWMFGNSFNDFLQIICNSLGRMTLARNSLVIQRGTVLIGVVTVLILHPTLEVLVIAMALGSILGTFFSTAMVFNKTNCPFNFQVNFKKWKEILRVSFPNAITVSFATWYLRLGAIILAWYWTAKNVGEYSAAFRLLEITYICAAAIMSISSPHLSEIYNQKKEIFRSEILRIFGLMFVFGGAWSLFLYFMSHNLITIIFGMKYVDAVPILKIFAAASFLISLNFVTTHLLIVVNQQKRMALYAGVAFCVGLILYITIIPKSASEGAALSLLYIESVMLFLTGTYLFSRMIKKKIL